MRLPFSVFTSTVLVAFAAICFSIGMKTHSELEQARRTTEALKQQIAARRIEQVKLRREIEELSTNPRAIEHAAREMGMVKRNEVVVLPADKPR